MWRQRNRIDYMKMALYGRLVRAVVVHVLSSLHTHIFHMENFSLRYAFEEYDLLNFVYMLFHNHIDHKNELLILNEQLEYDFGQRFSPRQ